MIEELLGWELDLMEGKRYTNVSEFTALGVQVLVCLCLLRCVA